MEPRLNPNPKEKASGSLRHFATVKDFEWHLSYCCIDHVEFVTQVSAAGSHRASDRQDTSRYVLLPTDDLCRRHRLSERRGMIIGLHDSHLYSVSRLTTFSRRAYAFAGVNLHKRHSVCDSFSGINFRTDTIFYLMPQYALIVVHYNR